MAKEDALRLGIVGCGSISHAHGQAAQSIPDVRFVACCDIREEIAQAWAAQYGCDAVYTDYEAMVRQEESVLNTYTIEALVASLEGRQIIEIEIPETVLQEVTS